MERFAQILIRRRIPLVFLVLALVGAAVSLIPTLELDFSITRLIESNEESRRRVEAFEQELPSQPVDLMCTLEWEQPLTRQNLALLGRIEEEINLLKEVRETSSLASVEVISSTGLPVPVPFTGTLGDGSVSDTALSHPLFHGRLISRSGRAASIIVFRDQEVDADVMYQRVSGVVAPLVGDEVDVRFHGSVLVERAIKDYMAGDMTRALVLETLVFILLLPLLFRTARGTIIPLLAVWFAVALDMGMMAAFGMKVTLLDVSVPGLVLVIGLCDSIHLQQRFEEAYSDSGDKAASIVTMMRSVARSCFYTSFTTAIGFLSLTIADHETVAAFGLKAAIAVLTAFVTVIVVVPVCLAVWPVGAPGRGRLPALDRLRLLNPRVVLLGVGVVVLASVVGTSRIIVNSHWLEEMPQGAPLSRDMDWLEDNFGGLIDFDMRVEGDLSSPVVFRALEGFQEEVLELDGVSKVESYTQWIREILGNPDQLTDVSIKSGFARLSLAGEHFPRHILREDHQVGRLAFRIEDIGSQRYEHLVASTGTLMKSLPSGVDIRIEGVGRMAHESNSAIIGTMIDSLGLTALAITLFVALVFRSIRIGLLSIPANLLPVLAGLGLAGWLGVPVRTGILMIFSLGIGLAVDDSIHLLARFDYERRRHPEEGVDAILGRCLRSTGSALVVTSVILTFGTLCFLPSQFQSMRDTGIILTCIVVVALLADLFFLPLLIRRWFRGTGAG